jgi:hypothetical protein
MIRDAPRVERTYVVPLGYLADPVTLPAASGHELVEETVTFDR